MFKSLKERLAAKFPPGKHQTCHLYDEIMDHLGLSGVEGEEAAKLVMMQLDYECFLEIKPSMLLTPDLFEMVGHDVPF